MLALSNQTGITANELNEGLYQALSAGVKVTEDMAEATDFMAKSAKLAKGGFTTVERAVDATTSVINAYGLSLEEAENIQKMLIQTQNLGKTTVDELASSLSGVTGTASTMGVSFSQVSAALAQVTSKGTPTAQAVTQLNALFAELGKNGTKASGALQEATKGTEYAGKSFIELSEAGVSTAEILQLISDYAGESDQSLLDMFSSIEAGKGAVSLLGNSTDEYNKKLEAMSTNVDVVGEAFDKMTNTFESRQERLTQSVTNLGISVFQSFKDSASGVQDFAQNLIDQLAQGFEDGGIEGVVGAIGQVLAQVVAKIGEEAPQFITLGANLLKNLIDGLANAESGGASSEIINSIIDGITLLLPSIVELGIKVFESLIQGIASATSDIPIIGDIFQSLADNIEVVEVAIIALTAGFVAFTVAMNIVALIQGVQTALQGMTVAQYALNVAMSLNPIGIVIGLIASLIAGLVYLWNTNDDFRDALISAWEKIAEATKTIWGGIVNFFTVDIPKAFNVVLDFVRNNWKELLLLIVNPISGAVALLYKLNPQFKEWIDGLVDSIVTKVSGFAKIGATIVTSIWEGISSMGSWLLSKVSNFFNGIVDSVKKAFGVNSSSSQSTPSSTPQSTQPRSEFNPLSARQVAINPALQARPMLMNGATPTGGGSAVYNNTSSTDNSTTSNITQNFNMQKSISVLEQRQQIKQLSQTMKALGV